MKKFIVIIVVVLVVLFALPAAIFFTVQHPAVQQRLVNEATHMLSEKLHTTVNVGSIRFRLFNRLVLEGVYIQDLQGDTLFYACEAAVSLSRFRPAEKYIEVRKLELDDVRFDLLRDSAGTNLNFIVNSLKSQQEDSVPKPQDEKPYTLRVNRVVVQGLDFSFVDKLMPDTIQESTICYKQLKIKDLCLDVCDLNLEGDTMSCRLESLSLRERSGFNLRRLGGMVSVAPTFIEIKGLQIRDDFSDIRANFYRMDFSDYSAFPDYVERVRMSADFTSAKVNLKTIGFFANPLSTLRLPLNLTGYVEGTVSNLKGRNLDVRYGTKTAVNLNFSMRGLPDAQNTFFTFDIKNLESTERDLLLADSTVMGEKLAKHAELIHQLGMLKGRARFTGFLSSFVADGQLATDVGTMLADVSIVPSADSSVSISGTLGTSNFNLGRVLNDSIVGHLSVHGKVKGTFKSVEKMALNLDVDLPLLELKGYRYRATKMKGLLTEKSFNGRLSGNDPNLNFNFYGNVNFEKEKPIFNFDLQLRHADLVQLRLNTRDSISRLSFTAKANAEGNSVDNFAGQVVVSDAKFLSPMGEFVAATVQLNARNQGDGKLVLFRSDALDASLQAKGKISNMLPTLNLVMEHYTPVFARLLSGNKLQPQVADTAVVQQSKTMEKLKQRVGKEQVQNAEYNFSLTVKNAKQAFEVIAPNIAIADSTQVSARISTDVRRTRLNVNTSFVRFDSIAVSNLALNSSARDSLHIAIKVDTLVAGNLDLTNLNVGAAFKGGKAAIFADYTTAIASGNFKAITEFFEDKQGNLGLDVGFQPSKLVLGDTLWNLSQSRLRIEKGKYFLSRFRIESGNQMLYADGVISKSMSDTLSCEVRNLMLNPMMRVLGTKLDLSGTLSGKVNVNGVLAPAPLFFADVRALDIYVEKREVGNITLQSFIEPGKKDATLSLGVERGGATVLGVDGLVKATGEIAALATLNGLELTYLNSLLEGTLSGIGGTLDGNLKMSGPLKSLMLNGKLQLNDGTLRVNLLNSLFKVAGTVDVESSTLYMRDWMARDDKNSTSKLNFTLGNVTQPSQLYYSLRIEPRNFHVLNSNALQNETFYGQGYATGVVQISGRSGEASISVAAATDPHTQLSIPIAGTASALQQADLIDFVTPTGEAETDEEEKVRTTTNLKADLDFRVTPDAEVMLVLNQNTGDVIRAAGTGNVKLEVQPANNIFRIFGSYSLLRGEYTVSMQNLFDLKFKIESGSLINFNGNIAAATADIQASYRQLRVPLAGLFDSVANVNNRYSRPVPIDCKVHITGNLTAPTLNFSIDAPTVDAETRDRMRAQLNTEDNIVAQFMSLILIGQFQPPGNTVGANMFAGGIEGLSLSSFLTSQVAGLLSQFVKGVDVSVKMPAVGSSSPTASQDWGATASTSFLDDRLSLGVGLESQSRRKQLNPNASSVVYDVDVQYMLDKQGRVRLKAFSHANDQYTNVVQDANRFGVGVVYQEDFDSFADLWKAIFRKKKTQDSILHEQKKMQEDK